MLTHYDPYTGILTATCGNEELHCIRDANLPIDTERAKAGRDLLERLQRLKEERENLGDYVEVHVGLANGMDEGRRTQDTANTTNDL